MRIKGAGAFAAAIAAIAVGAGPAQAQISPVATDLGAPALALLTGGTQRVCATSAMGARIRCVENVRTLPSGSATASAVTYGHWVFCKRTCGATLLVHEKVHVSQWETFGDLFGPMYLLEAALHGTGCENQWERPAYQATGAC